MKKFLLMVSVLFMASCATVTKYPQLTMDKVKEICEPGERWSINVIGLSTYATVSLDCLEFKRLFIVRLDHGVFTEEIRQKTVELLKLHFIQFSDNRTDRGENEPAQGTVKWSLRELKTEVDKHKGVVTYFFDLTFKVIK